MSARATDRRQQRTREAIRKAFLKLAMGQRYEDFTVSELIDTAGIGKSTFYDHYKGKDDVLRTLMDGMLTELAEAAAGNFEHAKLRGLVAHFWHNRRLGRVVFGPQLGPAIRRRLAELTKAAIEAQRDGPTETSHTRAAFAAAGQVGLLYAWLSGELSANVEDVATALASTARPSV
jgi:AcrR family transcriptional regulator